MSCEEVICDANNLYDAYLASIQDSQWKESVQRFMLHFMPYIFDIRNDLLNRTLVNGPTHKFILNERGRTRCITSLCVRDRIIRHSLCDNVLFPAVRKKIIYDNGASIKDRGTAFSRKRFEVHLRRYYKLHGNEGYILFGDFRKFYDNIVHDIAKQKLLDLVDNDEFVKYLLDVIFDGFKIDVSYMTDEEYENCIDALFNKMDYLSIPKEKLTGEKYMAKSVNIGDQLSQIIGIYYPNEIDTFVKYVCGEKFYGRFQDDFYIINQSKDRLLWLLDNIEEIAKRNAIHLNKKKTKIVKLSDTYTYLQVKYTLQQNGKIPKRIGSKKVTRMRRKLRKLGKRYQNGEAIYEYAEPMFKSWMGEYYKLMTRGQRKSLISTFEDSFDKQIKVLDKKIFIT